MVEGELSLDLFEDGTTVLPVGMRVLEPFQVIGRDTLRSRDRFLLADKPGTGKTIQGLAALEPEKYRLITVGNAPAKGVWKRECLKWRRDITPIILNGRDSFRWPLPGELIITGYDTMPERYPDFPKIPFTLIGDEAHKVKNNKSQRTHNFRELAKLVRKHGGKNWAFTASPLHKKPVDLWHLLYTFGLAEEAFGSWPNFMRLFCARKTRFGIQWGQPLPEVQTLLARVMLRRDKPKTMKTAPQDIDCEIDRKSLALCNEAVLALSLAGIDLDKSVDLAQITRLKGAEFGIFATARKALATAKIPAMLDVVEDFEEQEEPLIVFSAHRPPIDALGNRADWAIITGETPAHERTRIEEEFQAGRYKGIGLSIQAGGTALTLTRAAFALFVDLDLNWENNDQAEDRLDRMTQTRAVQIMRLISQHKLDTRLFEILSQQQSWMEGAIGRGQRA